MKFYLHNTIFFLIFVQCKKAFAGHVNPNRYLSHQVEFVCFVAFTLGEKLQIIMLYIGKLFSESGIT